MKECPYCGTALTGQETNCPKCKAGIPVEKPKAKKPKEKE